MSDTPDLSTPPVSETGSRDTSGSERRLDPRRWLAFALLVALGSALVWGVLRGGDRGAIREVTGTDPAPGARFPWEMSPEPESLIPLEEIRSGGPPPDGIPSIDEPSFVSASEANGWLEPREPVISLVRGDEIRAYPLQIVTWHEIVNDSVGGEPITVTFCPLCNSAIAFERRVPTTPEAEGMLGVDEAVLDFGTSGRLYRSNLVMYDRQTKSLWVQFTGRSVTGPFMSTELEFVGVQIVSWEDMRGAHPDVLVLSRDTGHDRPYGQNPYEGYDDVDQRPFLFDGEIDDRLRAMDRVLTVRGTQRAKAYPYRALETRAGSDGVAAVHDGEAVIFYRKGTASALDASDIAAGRDVGATGVFSPRHGDRALTIEVRGGRMVDVQTGSTWNLLGEAVSGPLAGARLDPVVHDDTFWFVWAAFEPDTEIWPG